MMRLAAFALALILAPAAAAEPAMIVCQPDKKIEKGASETISESGKARGLYQATFAFDLATGKACQVNHQYKMCVPDNWTVKPAESPGQIVFSRSNRDNSISLYLVNPETGRFRANLGTYELVGQPGACKPFTDFAVAPPG